MKKRIKRKLKCKRRLKNVNFILKKIHHPCVNGNAVTFCKEIFQNAVSLDIIVNRMLKYNQLKYCKYT